MTRTPDAQSSPDVGFSPLKPTSGAERGGAHLSYLSEAAGQLGVDDPVRTHLLPAMVQWRELRAEATRWRSAAQSAAETATALEATLGKLDAGWDGASADAFVGYVRRIIAAGTDAQEAMSTLADALDEVARGTEQITGTLAEVLLDAAETVSETVLMPVGGEDRARAEIVQASRWAAQLRNSVRDILEEFTRLCDGVGSGGRDVVMEQRYPAEPFVLPEENTPGVPNAGATSDALPDATTSAQAAGDEEGQGVQGGLGGGTPGAEGFGPVGGGQPAAGQSPVGAPPAPQTGSGTAAPMMGGMMPMGMGMGAGQGGQASQRQPRRGAPVDPTELVGKADYVAPAVLGEDPKPPPSEDKAKRL
ncbi:WXG100 family type VII secretion target [Amycolatopsis suaedae]|uniref:WXG100 family type VII secretion target n=1 Tax=Amycolatopsis suaedae TaxID=2510978 RepID=A0A4Q7JAV7_9PSEU|nr:WXG100 family type VII secretion target [Amycolatopsis suaedae]RZQ64092.1 WXG100 family type VII secretion target [Amycolatopsis suaedae]